MVPKTITWMGEIHLELRSSTKVLLSELARLIKIMRWAMEQFCDPSGNILVVSSEQPSNKSYDWSWSRESFVRVSLRYPLKTLTT